MKKIFLVACLLFLLGCGTKKATLESQDVKSDTHVLVTAEKEGMGDPFLVNIQVKGHGMQESVGTEIYAGDLDSSNVHFEWREPGVCLIVFTQQDNTQRKILAVALENKIGLKEIGLE